MFVVASRAGAGPRPALLTGYGGFGIHPDAAYSPTALAWVDAGGVYALASLRGGGEEGEAWHRAGNRDHKQNVFDDFHAAAQALVDTGTTTADQLAILGGSNGGLLVGAALTQRPERYRAVVCSAPLLDMVRYERFSLGRTWNDEYGTADDPDAAGLAALVLPLPPRPATAPPTRPCCSPSSTPTAASTRCTPARCAPPCSTPPRVTRRPGRSCCAARPTSGTAPGR